jgi:hypothetical protein
MSGRDVPLLANVLTSMDSGTPTGGTIAKRQAGGCLSSPTVLGGQVHDPPGHLNLADQEQQSSAGA